MKERTSTSGLSRREALAALLAGCALPSLLRADEASGEVPWLDEVQRPPAAVPTDAPKLSPLLVDDGGCPITTLADWKRRRESLRQEWLRFLGELETGRSRTPEFTIVKEDRPAGVVRQLIRYEIEPGETTEAYLLKPAKIAGRTGGVVAFHSTVFNSIEQPAGVGMAPSAPKTLGLGFAQRGYVAICPRNFLWSRNQDALTFADYGAAAERFQRRHPGSKGMAKMLYDSIAALNILTSLPEVDASRLGAVGHSLGAKESLYLAAFDDRIRAAVSSEGGIGIKFSNWDAPWYLGEEVRQAGFNRDHHELLAMIAPRPFLLLAGETGKSAADGARSWPYLEAAMPVYRLYGGRPRLAMFNHGQGHAMPPEAERRLYEWIEAYC